MLIDVCWGTWDENNLIQKDIYISFIEFITSAAY